MHSQKLTRSNKKATVVPDPSGGLHSGHMDASASPVLLERTIGISFRKKDLLHQALTHRSAVRRSRAGGHNERLEFLGDAVLELVATEHLFQYTEKTEGELTSWRAALVQGEHLARVAAELKLGEYLHMSRGEEASGGRNKESTLANALEALIGAIFLDQGYDPAKQFCEQFILVRLRALLAQGKDKDTKSLLQEKAQEFFGITPHYDVIADDGPDHDKTFVCAVFVGEEKIAEGKGNSKQKAEQDAAKNGLKARGWK
jgi:ribonuclease-3